MYTGKSRIRQCTIVCAVLLAAVLIQGLAQSKKVQAWSKDVFSVPALASWALYLQTGVAVKPSQAEPVISYTQLPGTSANNSDADAAGAVSGDQEAAEDASAQADPAQPQQEQAQEEPQAQAPADAAELAQPLSFSAAEADAISIVGACTYPVDKAALLTTPSAMDFSQDGPKVLIVHTHTTEAYTIEDGWEYDALLRARTLDETHNVVRVGQEVASVLESYGIGVVHDKTVNDYPSYNGSYDRMKTIIANDLAANPSIQMVLDIHRDAAEDADGNPLAVSATFQDEKYAQIMLVVGTDQGGLYHPNWSENLGCALKVQALLNRNWSGLCRSLDLRQERFNQNQTPGSMLVEFGTDGNTLQQALRSATVFGKALAQLILAQQQ